jgi:hypothetical protein
VSGLTDALTSWAALYARSDTIQFTAACGHLLSIAYAARYALRGDRAVLRMTSSNARTREVSAARGELEILTGAHRHVITGLCFALITGIAQLTAQLDYLPQSPIFWTKMLLLVLLLANGRIIQLAGRRADLAALRPAAIRSLALWGITVLTGLLLTTVRPS